MRGMLRQIANRLCPRYTRTGELHRALTLYFKKGDLGRAYEAFSAAIERQPELLQIGDVCVLWAHMEFFVKHDPRRALSILERARDMKVQMLDLYYLVQARSLWHVGDHEAALDYFERSIAAERSTYNLMEFASFLTQVDNKRATTILAEILERDPANCRAWIYMGFNAARAGDTANARAFAEKSEALSPGDNELYELGRLYNELGDFRSAIRAFLQASERGFWHRSDLHEGLAESYMALGDTEAARDYTRKALEDDPDNERANDLWRASQKKGSNGDDAGDTGGMSET